ncbi:hypothetical protein QCA50_017405 [Cerrena zonata]|uniref:Uncharacterized protein n=1 Tax=Cerrena zonata TaxID=2478898 RepID=A0AAW0FKQ2_9APHY
MKLNKGKTEPDEIKDERRNLSSNKDNLLNIYLLRAMIKPLSPVKKQIIKKLQKGRVIGGWLGSSVTLPFVIPTG